ncbi:MAG: PP2C family serine/threonine-protein phosphatase [Novosphingobium sp.]
MGFECAARTHVGHRRKLNEDSLFSSAERRLWAVADGMGGHHAGDVASRMIVDELARVSEGVSLDNSMGKAMAAIEMVNQDLVDLARKEHEHRTIGSTVVGLIADHAEYRCFWVGDSRAYRVRDGVIRRLTRDHSLVQDLIDAGMLDPAEAETHPNANMVTRAVGATETLRIDSTGGAVMPGDIFLLASDGLTRLVGDDELARELSGNGLEAAADVLLELTLERGAPDNVSFILIRAA